MPFIETELPGLLIFEPSIFNDARGYFFEAYNENAFIDAGIEVRFVQDNQSSSSYGVIRGLHYQQQPYSQTKLIRVLEGSILDVVVDIRKGSPAFGKSFSLELSAENNRQLLVPAGFAHGFSVTSERAIVLYKCDKFYNKASEGGIHYADPALNIDWQIPTGQEIISDKDNLLPTLQNSNANFFF